MSIERCRELLTEALAELDEWPGKPLSGADLLSERTGLSAEEIKARGVRGEIERTLKLLS